MLKVQKSSDTKEAAEVEAQHEFGQFLPPNSRRCEVCAHLAFQEAVDVPDMTAFIHKHLLRLFSHTPS